ncbi:MAG TPA: TPM domain-containing protein [Polyangia bacterium]|jgi:uncharacterized membrane protein|nr:TPM domain-containing protein [Polyangia bacterium]
MLSRRAFLRRLDIPAVEAAIRRAEAQTSGEIRVSVAGFFRGDPRRLGERAFERLRMRATRHRNGVLILVTPARRQVLVLGDEGIHARVGDAFWTGVIATLRERLAHEQFTAGLLEAIEIVGRELARHFPPEPGDNPNELPDTVDRAGA